MFRRLVVFLDSQASNRGAFAYALDLATRLRLPLHGVRIGSSDNRTEQEWEAASSRRRVPWTLAPGTANERGGTEQASASELLVFGRSLPPARKQSLLHDAARGGGPGVFICPDAAAPLSRALLVDGGSPAHLGPLSAGEFCRALGVDLVVLTVGRSEREARQRRQEMQAAFAERGLVADFDTMIGSEVRVAVAQVARWRRCSFVIADLHDGAPWWRWWRSSPIPQLLDINDAFALMTMPTTHPAEWYVLAESARTCPQLAASSSTPE